MKFWLFLSALCIGCAALLDARTIQPASLSYSDVSAAIARAADGDTVQLPAGTATWSSGVTVTKAITIVGAGSTATTINGSIGYTSYLFEITGGVPGVRFTGIRFDLRGNGGAMRFRNANSSSNRIDHCAIQNCGYTSKQANYGRGVQFVGYKVYGVIDHCIFTNNSTHVEVLGADTHSWNDPVGLGSLNAIVMEDNNFVNNPKVLSRQDAPFYNSNGARTLFRRNTVDITDPNAGSFWDSHGNNQTGYTTSTSRGTIYTVIDSNTLNVGHPNYGGKVFYIRGGIFIFANNTVTSDRTGSLLNLTEEECWYPWWGGLSTYPRQDQVTNSWIYNNTLNGAPVTSASLFDPGIKGRFHISGVIRQGRDYFVNQTPPAYNPNANFAASGPSHGYTPLVYPHPLVTAGGGPELTLPTIANPTPLGTTQQVGGAGQTTQQVGRAFDSTQGILSGPFTVNPDHTISQAVENMDPSQGGEARYLVEVTTAGDYAVDATVYAPHDSANSLFVNFNTAPTSPDMIWDIPANNGLTKNVVTRRASGGDAQVWSLSAGVHTLILRGREAGLKVGQITIVNRSKAPTSGGSASASVGGAGQTTQQVGRAFDSTQGILSGPFTVNPDHTISQAVENMDPSQGGEARYLVEVTTAGDYAVDATVYAPDDSANSLFVNFNTAPTSPDMIWDIPANNGLTKNVVTRRGSGGDAQVWSLSAGVHTLILRGREAGLKVGQITIVNRPKAPQGLRVSVASD